MATDEVKQKVSSDFIRNFVFGVEDSLVSTIGLISGVAVAGVSKSTLILTGIILVFVEAFSMAVGSLLSDNSAKEYSRHKVVPFARSIGSSLIMFLSYFLSGFVILLPYVVFTGNIAFWTSIGLSLVFLFILGVYIGRLSGIPVAKRGFTMALIGGLAILIGVSVGSLLQNFNF